jgi:hypothetical protein
VERIFHLERRSGRQDIARYAIGFVRDARRPLSIRELWWLLSMRDICELPSETDLHSWELIKSCCHGPIEGNGLNNVDFIHSTILDCMQHKDYSNRIPPQDYELAKRCLFYLNNGDLSTGVSCDLDALDRRPGALPLLEYAARYWPDHFKRTLAVRCADFSKDPTSETLHNLARTFLSQDMRVEATFQVTLSMDRNRQLYLRHILKDTPVKRASL